MLRAGIAFLTGIVCAIQAPAILHLAWWCAAAAMVLALARPGTGRVLLLGLTGGLVWSLINAGLHFAQRLPPAVEGRDLVIAGRVVGVPSVSPRFTRFEFAPRSVPGGVRLPRLLRLSWYRNAPALRPGEHWRLTVRLRRVHGLRNPGTFDYEAWSFARGIGALGYVRHRAGNRRLGRDGSGWLDRRREALAARIAAAGYARGGLLVALVTGLRQGMSTEHWAVLRSTGTSHLFAISGLHVGLAAWFGHLLAALGWRALPALGRCAARQRCAAVGALLAALAYAALAGFSLPTQRALLTLAILLGGVVCARGVRPGAALGAALLGVLVLDPWAPLGAGFWLSFTAVAGIAWVLAARAGTRRHGVAAAVGFLRVQVCLSLLLVPLLLLFFQRSAAFGVFANLLAVPLVALVTVPCALLGAGIAAAGHGSNPALWLADASLGWLWPVLQAMAAWPVAEWLRAAPGPLALGSALGGVLLLCAPRLPLSRALGLVLLLPLLFPSPSRPAPGGFRLHVLDVGQGLAAVVETRDHVLVYDAGARYSASFDMGRAVVVPVLRALGRRRLDVLLISHPDGDHSGGAASVLDALPVGRVLASVPQSLGDALAGPARACAAGQAWNWDGVRFEVLHPAPQWAGGRNDRSCVLRVSALGHAVLLSGDIEARAEQYLLDTGAPLRADVLVVPHHGSRTSSTPAFVSRVRPRYAVIAAGFRNRYGFPHPAVHARLRRAGAQVLETAASGALRFEVGPAGVSAPRRFRLQARRFWHSLPVSR